MGIATGNFFERCKKCRACCKTSDSYVHIYVCSHEERLAAMLSSMSLDAKDIVVPRFSPCMFHDENGCTLGDVKPFQCRLYPVLFLCDGSMGIDSACTYSGEYVSQLEDPSSDARLHLESMKKEASRLGEKEKRALAEWSRLVCDVIALGDEGSETSGE